MARSTDINQRIVLTGAEEVRRHLEEIAASGQKAGNQTRAALLAATQGANTFTAGARSAGASSGQMRFALQNLSFQVNDVATSLASGGDAMRVFAQQGGQVFQAFQQGGGIGNVLSAAAASIRNMITPTTAAVAGFAALAAGFGLVVAQAVHSQAAAREFDVILKGIGKSSQANGKDLEALAHSFHDVGLSAAEGEKAVAESLRAGIKPADLEKVIRAGANLNTVLGEGSLQEFIKAAGQGGPALEAFAKKLGIIPGVADETVKALKAAAEEAGRASKAFDEAFRQRDQALADESRNERRATEDQQRQLTRERIDATRERGTAEEELRIQQRRQEEDRDIQSKRRIEDINREHAKRINDLIRQRNEANAKALAEFNEKITADAAKALGDSSLINQIAAKVGGSFGAALGALGKALNDLSGAWDKFMQSLAQSGIITSIVTGLQSFVTAISNLLQGQFSIAALGAAILVALPAFAALRIAAIGVSAALGPIGLGLAIIGLAAALIDVNKAWEGWKAGVEGAWTLLKAFVEWLGAQFGKAVDEFIISPIKSVLEFFQNLIDKAREAANAIASVFGGGGRAPVAEAPIPSQQLAAGGPVVGPGGIDNVPLMGTAGEFMMSRPAVEHYGIGMMAALNARILPIREMLAGLSRPIMPPTPRFRFNTGGLVTAGAGAGGGVPVHFHLDVGSFVLRGDRDVVQSMIRGSRKSAMLSAGRKPSTA